MEHPAITTLNSIIAMVEGGASLAEIKEQLQELLPLVEALAQLDPRD